MLNKDFSKFGKHFQENLVQIMFEDRAFCDQVGEVFKVEFLVRFLFKQVMFMNHEASLYAQVTPAPPYGPLPVAPENSTYDEAWHNEHPPIETNMRRKVDANCGLIVGLILCTFLALIFIVLFALCAADVGVFSNKITVDSDLTKVTYTSS